jgi:hypothetical protein
MAKLLRKYLNIVTVSYLDSEHDPCHTSTYIFLSSVPVAIIPDHKLIFDFLRPFVVDESNGNLGSYEFRNVSNIVDIEMLPELKMPFVDVEEIRNQHGVSLS